MSDILKFAPFQAPARYVFKDPDTGHIYIGVNLQQLYTQIRQYREQNRLPEIQHLDSVVEHFLCALPENLGKCEAKPLRRGFFQYLKGGITLLTNVVIKDMATQMEADRRSSICAPPNEPPCPANIFPDKEGFIRWSDEVAEGSIGKRKSLQHDKLGNCQICSCTLKPKVWYRKVKPTEKEASQMREINPRCWQIE